MVSRGGIALNTTSILIAVHLFGVILWIGGLVTAGLTFAFADHARREVAQAARRAMRFLVTPGMLLAWVAGLAVLIPSFSTSYATAGWMHGKLTLALFASGAHGFLSGKLRKIADGTAEPQPGAIRGVVLGVLVIALVVVGLVILRPGS